jgi:hypothetical protein
MAQWPEAVALLVLFYTSNCSFLLTGGRRRQRWAGWAKNNSCENEEKESGLGTFWGETKRSTGKE